MNFMKLTLAPALAIAFLATTSMAQSKVIKSCSTNVPSLEQGQASVPLILEIVPNGDSLIARVTQNGFTYEDDAEVKVENVRANILINLDDIDKSDLNYAEKLITHAMTLTKDPELSGKLSAGFDLSKVRSAKYYTVGKKTKFGSSTIIEARDENGALLGSFLGGFLVSPCD